VTWLKNATIAVSFFVMGTDFRKNLRSELDYLDWTVKELSARTGIAKGTLNCYLGVRASIPTADAAVKIAEALGVSVEYLVTGREESREPGSLPIYSHQIRSVLSIMLNLGKKDNEILLELAKTLQKQSEKPDRL
jgi:transcriptional regulator with XRE-family HTH domain